MRSKTLAFKKRIAIVFCAGARACVRVLCVQKTRRFAFAFLSPLSPLVCMVPTPYFLGNQLVLCGSGASCYKMKGLDSKPPILHKPECTAVAAIQLRMRMRILTRPENSLANYNHQITNKKAANEALRRNSLANANVFANEMRKFRSESDFLGHPQSSKKSDPKVTKTGRRSLFKQFGVTFPQRTRPY